MGEIDSDSHVTAQLSRLIGLASLKLDGDLSEAALRAAGALCDFNAGSDARTRCLAAASAVAAGGSRVAFTVHLANDCAHSLQLNGRDVFCCAVEVSLTLLEGAAVQAGPAPEELSEVSYVTGQHSWLLNHHWVHAVARFVAIFDDQRVMRSDRQSPADLQRKVVMTGAFPCAPFPTCFSGTKSPATLFHRRHIYVLFPKKGHYMHARPLLDHASTFANCDIAVISDWVQQLLICTA